MHGTGIINGDVLYSAILREAGVHNTETFVAVTEDDEVNILSALLAKRTGAKHAVALVNIPGFIPLVSTLGVDAVINPSQITVSSILEHVRSGRIRDVHPIIEDLGEVLEAEALPSSLLVGKPLRGQNSKRLGDWRHLPRWQGDCGSRGYRDRSWRYRYHLCCARQDCAGGKAAIG